MQYQNIYNILKSTPTFPEEIYSDLPALLKECTDPFIDSREKDILLTGCLVVLGGCFSNCQGKYDKDSVHPNLYAFNVAPPASGKGVMKYAPMLGKDIQDELVRINKEAKEKYEAELQRWKKLSKKEADNQMPPVKPAYPILFIPGNSSSTAIYKLLDISCGIGIICETEADTLSGAIKQDWGNYSHLLRSAFHHEPLSLSRSTEDTYILIDKPRLSTLLTGTPDQVSRLIASTEDGLNSRFLFYCYSREMKWKEPKPCLSCPDIRELFISKSATVATIKKYLDSGSYDFSLTDSQFELLSIYFAKKVDELKHFEGAGAVSSVYRLGLITFRIAMILTILRQMENPSGSKNLVCGEKDFVIAMKLIEVYFEHSMIMNSILPTKSQGEITSGLRTFYNTLPKEPFQRKKANEIGKSIGISEKSVQNYLAKLTGIGYVEKPAYGKYKKKSI